MPRPGMATSLAHVVFETRTNVRRMGRPAGSVTCAGSKPLSVTRMVGDAGIRAGCRRRCRRLSVSRVIHRRRFRSRRAALLEPGPDVRERGRGHVERRSHVRRLVGLPCPLEAFGNRGRSLPRPARLCDARRIAARGRRLSGHLAGDGQQRGHYRRRCQHQAKWHVCPSAPIDRVPLASRSAITCCHYRRTQPAAPGFPPPRPSHVRAPRCTAASTARTCAARSAPADTPPPSPCTGRDTAMRFLGARQDSRRDRSTSCARRREVALEGLGESRLQHQRRAA